MTQYLPQNLLALFSPREPVVYFPPLDVQPQDKKPWPYSGVGQYLRLFEDPKDTPPPTRGETKEERINRKQLEREDRHKDELLSKLEEWEPSSDLKIQGDPFKTIFVGRINYDTSESKLRRELEAYGPIKRITMVTNDGKPRGYAFIEYEKERDMHNSYKYGDGKKIDGRRVVVDVERGRTVKSWKPRRLGGGLGGTRKGTPQENIKYSGRVDERDMEGSDGKEEDHDREREPDRRRRSQSRDRDRDRDRERDRDRDRFRERERGDRERDRGDRDWDRGVRDRERGDRDRERGDRDRERGDRDRERGDRDRERDKDRERDRDKDRERVDRDRDREKKEKRKRSRSRDRNDKDRKSRKDRDKSRRDHGDGEGERKKHRADSEEEGQIIENNG